MGVALVEMLLYASANKYICMLPMWLHFLCISVICGTPVLKSITDTLHVFELLQRVIYTLQRQSLQMLSCMGLPAGSTSHP